MNLARTMSSHVLSAMGEIELETDDVFKLFGAGPIYLLQEFKSSGGESGDNRLCQFRSVVSVREDMLIHRNVQNARQEYRICSLFPRIEQAAYQKACNVRLPCDFLRSFRN